MTSSLHAHLDWTGLLQQWARSDHSPAELARTLGLEAPERAELAAETGGLFSRAEVVDARPRSGSASCWVHLPGRAALELDDTIDPHWAAALIRALEQPA